MNKKNDAICGATHNPLHDSTKDAVLQVLMTAALDGDFYGKDRRVTRASLAMRAHTDDRTARAAVSELRKEGVPICATRDGRGYWYGTPSEYEALVIRDYESRLADMAETVRAWKRARTLEGQVTFNEVVF